MDLRPYVENLELQLTVAADAGGEDARALAERLIASLDAAVRLTLLDVLTAAAEEITCDLAPGSVEVRLRGREPELVVTPAPVDEPTYASESASEAGVAPFASVDGEDGAMSRINLRMPDRFKARIDRAAGNDGLSVNAWLVRAAAVALERTGPDRRRHPALPRGAQRYTGWAR